MRCIWLVRESGEADIFWREGLLELTDIEIYELGLKVIADSLGAYGFATFIMSHFKSLSDIQSLMPDNSQNVASPERVTEVELLD